MEIVLLLMIMLALTLLIMLPIFLFLMYVTMFPHHVTLIKDVNGANQVYKSRAKNKKNEDGTFKWKLFKSKILQKQNGECFTPTRDSIMIDGKGKIHATGFVTSEDEVVWGCIDAEAKNIKPIITKEDRVLHINDLKRAKEIKGSSLGTIIIPVAAMAILAIVIIMGMFMWKDLAQPAIRVHEINQGTAKEQTRQWEIIQQIDQDIQIIKSNTLNLDEENKPRPIPD